MDIPRPPSKEKSSRDTPFDAGRRETEVRALLNAARAVLEYHSFKDAARAIFSHAKELIGASAGYVALFNEDAGENEVIFLDSGGEPCRVNPTLPMPIRGLREIAYRLARTAYENDFASTPWARLLPEGHVRVANVMFAPLLIEGRTVGLLGLANKPEPFNDNDARLASGFTELAAIALTNKWTEEKRLHLTQELEQQADQLQQALDRLKTVNRALKCLSSCSRAVMAAASEAELLREICRIVAEEGEYRLAWVGFAEAGPKKRVVPVAQAGYEAGYIETLQLTWADTERGRGPTGTAIRTGAPAIARNILTDPRFSPWRAEAVKRGYASTIALPLKMAGKTFGALNIYATEPNAFDSEEVKLLTELADSLVFGLKALRDRSEREHAEEKLRQAHEELETRIADRTAELRLANEQLQQEMKEHREDQKRLEESEARFTFFMKHLPGAAVIRDLEGRYLFANEGWEKLAGKRPGEWLGKTVEEVWPAAQARRFKALDQEAQASKRPVEAVEALEQEDGRHYLLMKRFPILDAKGEPQLMGAIGIDITARLEVEKVLKAERNRLYALLDGLPAYIYLQGANYTLPFVNRAFKERFGDPQGKLCYEVLHGRQEPCEDCSAAQVFATQVPREWEWTNREGRTFQLYDYPFADIDGSPLVLEMGIDITERKQAEEALKQSEALLRNVLDTLPVGVWVADKEGRIILGNPASREIWGGARYVDIEKYGEYKGWWAGNGKPIAAEEWALARAIRKGETSVGEVIEIETFDGKRKTILNSAVPIRDAEGTISGAIVVNQDVTAQRQAEKDLLETSRLNQILMDSMPHVALLVRPYTREIVASNRFAREIGAVPGTKCYAGWSKLAGPCSWCLAEKLWKTGQAQSLEVEFEGGFYEAHWVPAGPDLYMHYAFDITQRKLTEKALLESESQLRLLAAKLLNAQEVERNRLSKELHDEMGQALIILKYQLVALEEIIKTYTDKSIPQCQNLLAYADHLIDKIRRISQDLSPKAVKELGLGAALKYLLEQFGKHSHVESIDANIDSIDELFPLPTQVNIYRIFQETLTNIGKHSNATKIVVAVKNLEDRVSFTVQDNGQGFNAEWILSYPAQAKGVGLAAMQERVRLEGGDIEIWSKPGKGAKISFVIPCKPSGG